jgi:streptomycin 3"-adenylyltransferase
VSDFHWGRELAQVNPVYFVLNACRVRAFLAEGLILSKDEGGEWALAHLAERHAAVIGQALRIYRGDQASEYWPPGAVAAFADEMARALA